MTPIRDHPPVSPPTKAALISLGVVELSMGVFALFGLLLLVFGNVAGTMPLAWGVLSPLTLLLLGGAGIFVRRPWSYLLHCLVTPVGLVGASVALAILLGPTRGTPVVAMTVVASGVLQLFFFTAEVHRWFDEFWGT
jgi:hypothetical protein